jgi:hypothetical protein
MFDRTRFEYEMASLRELQYDVPPPGTGAKTYYLPLDLKIPDTARITGAHVPSAAAGAKIVDVIVYFHGFVSGDPCYESKPSFDAKGMEYYWSHARFRNMRAELDASGRAALLVAPTLHYRVGAAGSGQDRYGNLGKPEAFDKFVKIVCDELVARKAILPSVKLGNIVLAAHSGGGSPMYAILGTRNKLRPKIRACWGFECLYPGEKVWLDWLNEDQLLRFPHFRQEGFLWRRAHALRDGTNKRFVDTTRLKASGAHCNLVKEFWNKAIERMPKVAGAKEAF